MKAGNFRDRIIIQERVTTITALGTTEIWSTVETRWARAVEIKTDGKAKYQQIGHDDVTHRFVFRGNVDIDMTKNRFVWRSERYEAVEPAKDPDSTGRYTTIAVRKVPENVES
jgi:head-tail adaptor